MAEFKILCFPSLNHYEFDMWQWKCCYLLKCRNVFEHKITQDNKIHIQETVCINSRKKWNIWQLEHLYFNYLFSIDSDLDIYFFFLSFPLLSLVGLEKLKPSPLSSTFKSWSFVSSLVLAEGGKNTRRGGWIVFSKTFLSRENQYCSQDQSLKSS